MSNRLSASNFGTIPITKTTSATTAIAVIAEHQPQRLADAVQVDADEDQVADQVDRPAAGQPEQPERLDVAADEDRDRGRRDRVLDEDRRAGGEPAERSQRAPGEAVAGAGHRHRRGQLGQAEHHAGVHDGHQHGRDQQAAPAALGQAEVPAGEVAGDDVGDAEPGQQHPAGRASLELPVLQVVLADLLVVDARAFFRLIARPPMVCSHTTWNGHEVPRPPEPAVKGNRPR